MSIILLTNIHTAISLVAIAAGVWVVGGILRAERMNGWNSAFLLMTFLTSATGFLFPVTSFLPSHAFAVISLILLVPALLGRYLFGLQGTWRWVYAVCAVILLYLNVFVLVVQAFLKVPAIHALAPTQAEPPFAIAQGITMLVFIVLGVVSVRRFRPI